MGLRSSLWLGSEHACQRCDLAPRVIDCNAEADRLGLYQIIFFPTPPLAALSARCTVYRSGALSISFASQLDHRSDSPALSVRIDREAGKMTLTRHEASPTGAQSAPPSGEAQSGDIRSTTRHRIPESDQAISVMKGITAVERDLVRWVLSEVAEDAERLLAELRRDKRSQDG